MKLLNWLILGFIGYFGYMLRLDYLKNGTITDWFMFWMMAAGFLLLITMFIEKKLPPTEIEKILDGEEQPDDNFEESEEKFSFKEFGLELLTAVLREFKKGFLLIACLVLFINLSLGSAGGDIKEINEDKAKKEMVKSLNREEPHLNKSEFVDSLFNYNTYYEQPFYQTMQYFHSGFLTDEKWHLQTEDDLTEDYLKDCYSNIWVNGHCKADVSFSGGFMIVLGDLDAKISVSGHTEILIKGEIKPGAEIRVDGIVRVLVGGDVNGTVISNSSLTFITLGNMNGELTTGSPSTIMVVEGDFKGKLLAGEDGCGMVRLMVGGFLSADKAQEIQSQGFTTVTAYIHASDCEDKYSPVGFSQNWYVENIIESSK